ncbi:glycosyltransferase family 4 protein [Alteribacter populi]|uniref:glycosyltransferase family 4 protein n=1 Tax=Alteribacter populi TaxID=2011011 RepID=UPI0012FFB121|nr:glycosyltransferase [Alteribacter populi]
MTFFIGPVGDNGGPAIKNRLLMKYLDRESNFKVSNTNDRVKSNLLKNILSLIMTKDKQIIVAVSRNGRSILYPILNMKKFLNPNINYSTICIGGTIVQDALKYPRTIKKTLKKADVITVETKKLKDELEEKLKLTNVHYMPNYKEIETDTLKPLPRFDTKALKFVFLSSVRNVKGVATMVNVFKEVLETYPTATLDIYGPIRKDFDMNVLENIKNLPQINYKGVVANEDVISTLSKYNVFIFPTEYKGEGFPAVLIEAYLAGLVVVASDINFNTEIVVNNNNGWIFPTGNKEKFKEILLNCFNNEETLKVISENNRKYANNFDAESVIENYRVALKKLEWKI